MGNRSKRRWMPKKKPPLPGKGNGGSIKRICMGSLVMVCQHPAGSRFETHEEYRRYMNALFLHRIRYQ